MTTEETRTKLQQLENRLTERTPPPIEGQTRLPLPPSARPDDPCAHQPRTHARPPSHG
ncbi:hypothetical protein [Streptomyces sp. NPDC003327]